MFYGRLASGYQVSQSQLGRAQDALLKHDISLADTTCKDFSKAVYLTHSASSSAFTKCKAGLELSLKGLQKAAGETTLKYRYAELSTAPSRTQRDPRT